MNNDILYQDLLIEISHDSIILKNYYFPSLAPKEIAIANIEKVEVKQPSIWTGKWRIHGTGNIRTWFPMDTKRNKRDKIFFIILKHQWFRIGCTVENSAVVQDIFKQKGLIH